MNAKLYANIHLLAEGAMIATLLTALHVSMDNPIFWFAVVSWSIWRATKNILRDDYRRNI